MSCELADSVGTSIMRLVAGMARWQRSVWRLASLLSMLFADSMRCLHTM